MPFYSTIISTNLDLTQQITSLKGINLVWMIEPQHLTFIGVRYFESHCLDFSIFMLETHTRDLTADCTGASTRPIDYCSRSRKRFGVHQQGCFLSKPRGIWGYFWGPQYYLMNFGQTAVLHWIRCHWPPDSKIEHILVFEILDFSWTPASSIVLSRYMLQMRKWRNTQTLCSSAGIRPLAVDLLQCHRTARNRRNL